MLNPNSWGYLNSGQWKKRCRFFVALMVFGGVFFLGIAIFQFFSSEYTILKLYSFLWIGIGLIEVLVCYFLFKYSKKKYNAILKLEQKEANKNENQNKV